MHAVHIEDRRLQPILEKVEAGVSAWISTTASRCFAPPIFSPLGYMANLVRERKHGNVT